MQGAGETQKEGLLQMQQPLFECQRVSFLRSCPAAHILSGGLILQSDGNQRRFPS